jgi:hypothetical protein
MKPINKDIKIGLAGFKTPKDMISAVLNIVSHKSLYDMINCVESQKNPKYINERINEISKELNINYVCITYGVVKTLKIDFFEIGEVRDCIDIWANSDKHFINLIKRSIE